MLEILLLLFFAIFIWVISRAAVTVIYYLLMYNLVAQTAFLLLGGLINFNGPVSFWVSRILFLMLAFWLGGLLRSLIEGSLLLRIVVTVGLLAFFFWLIFHGIDFNYYYFEQPLPPPPTGLPEVI